MKPNSSSTANPSAAKKKIVRNPERPAPRRQRHHVDGQPAYRIRWDDVIYEPGELKVVAYKDGKQWATDTVKTTGTPAQLQLKPDRAAIAGDGHDLSFVTLTVADKDGLMVPRSTTTFTSKSPAPAKSSPPTTATPTT